MSTIREPLFNFQTLTNSNTTFDWLLRTNQLIQGMNTLYVADVVEGDGICLARNGGIVQINIDPGPGLGFTNSKDLTLSFLNLSEALSLTTTSPTANNDYFIVGLPNSSTVRKIKANSILPPTILHNHTFDGNINFNNDIQIKPTKTTYDFTDRWTAKINVGQESSLMYEGYNSLWSFNGNLNLGTTDSFAIISNNIKTGIQSNTLESVFNFCTQNLLGTVPDTDSDDAFPTILSFNFNVGSAPEMWDRANVGNTNIWPTTWKLKFDTTTTKLYHYDSTGSDNNQELLSIEKVGLNDNLITVNGRIQITDLQNSEQFINTPDGSAYKVPLTNSVGLLDKKFTNRIITTDFTDTLQGGSLVVVSNFTDGDAEYSLAIADGIGKSDVIGIVESVSAGAVTIVLSGEFELTNAVLEPGTKYYLSQTNAGQYVAEGTYSSGIIKPVFVATSETTGLLLPFASAITSNIGSVIVNYGAENEETLPIDLQNYPLKFIAGPNIQFDLTSNDEIEIRVIDAAGAQDTFNTINVDGVGSTDGNNSITATEPNQAFTLKSNSLSIFADDITKQIQIETPNSFTEFRFSDTNSNNVYSADKANDVLHFIAGSGISFEQNTDDSIIISANISGSINATNINWTGLNQVIVGPDYNYPSGRLLSLSNPDDGRDGIFEGGWSELVIDRLANFDMGGGQKPITINLNVNPITFTYLGEEYSLDPSYALANQSIAYMPDALAGYVFGNITPSGYTPSYTGGIGELYYQHSIKRLTRRDMRLFLGIHPTGFIDSVANIFRQWTIFGTGMSPVEAANKDATIIFEAGSGIQLTVEDVSNTPRLKIANTGVAQNAYSTINTYSYEGVLTETLNAITAEDNLNITSGKFVKVFANTNNDLSFDISIDDDYVLLGNPGTTDGMNVIDLSTNNDCFVGRINGGIIQPITPEDLAFGATTSSPPALPLPYFGMIKLSGNGVPGTVYLNANDEDAANRKGYFTLVAGQNVTFDIGSLPNYVTINSSGTGDSTPVSTIKTILLDSSNFYTVSNAFDTLKFSSGNGILLTSPPNPVNRTVDINFSLASIDNAAILANSGAQSGIPSGFIVEPNCIVGRYLNSETLSNINITVPPAADKPSLKQILDIRHFNKWQIGTGTTVDATGVAGSTLRFAAGTGVSLSITGSSPNQALQISASTSLVTDSAPTFKTLFDEATVTGTTLKYGNSYILSANKKFLKQELYYINTFTTTKGNPSTTISLDGHVLSKEFVSDAAMTDLPTLVRTVTSAAGRTDQYYAGNSFTEHVYGTKYTLSVANYNTTTLTRGDLTLQGNIITFDSTSNITFGGSGSDIVLTNKYLRPSSSIFRLRSPNSGTPNLFITGYNSTLTTCSALINIQSKNGLVFDFANDAIGTSIPANGLKLNFAVNLDNEIYPITINGCNLEFTTSIKFSGINVDFTEVGSISGLVPSAHASTHQYAQDLASDGDAEQSDVLRAWQVGAVARLNPVINNSICIANGDGEFDFNTAINNPDALYGGSTVKNYQQFFEDTITRSTSSVGPMYVVLANGSEVDVEAEITPKGPPGQIIMIRAE
jgi:hypothetical protein